MSEPLTDKFDEPVVIDHNDPTEPIKPAALGQRTPEHQDSNLVMLAGTLATPPEHRVFDSGESLTRMLVTVRTTHPRRRVDVIPVILWTTDQPGDDALLDAQAGDRVWIAGTMQRRFWDAQDGRRSRIEVVAETVTVTPKEDQA